jgi:spermidine synthase
MNEEQARHTVMHRLQGAALLLAAFVSGAVLLAVEIAASRVVAPYFGNSLFVWGALIGVVLTGLAVGYWAGGTLADRLPHPGLLIAVATGGGLGVLAIPLVDDHVLGWVTDWDPGPRLDPLVAAVALFGLPSILFAAVTPIAVKLRARAVATLGRDAGRLFSISTAGSIVGTFATAFWLIPEFGTDQLLALCAAALFAAVTLYAVSERFVVGGLVTLAALVAASAAAVSLEPEQGAKLTGAAARNWSPVYRLREERGPVAADQPGEVVFRKDTRYHRITVVDSDGSRFLRFDNSYQSGMYVDRPYATRFEYTDYLDLGLAYNPRARNVLFVGLGGGSAPKRFFRDFPSLRLQVAELDPVVVDVAKRYFALPDDPRLRVTDEDGRRFLTKNDTRYDVIVLDAFYADAVPFHLTTLEFMRLVHERLAPGGVVVANIIGAQAGSQSRLLRSMYRTYRAVFPTVVVHPVNTSVGEAATDIKNIVVVAGDAPAPSKEFLQERWAEVRRRAPTAPDLRQAIRDRWDAFVPTADVPVLTDDYAPTDALLLVFD